MVTSAVSAHAAPSGAPSGPARSSSQFTLRREEAGGASAADARARARAGDCAGALASFDAAIRVTIEPTLRRDRGLCHEKLDHPFPAIDDYRAYLVARPDAPDADQIRDRLSRLEEAVGVGSRSKESSDGAWTDAGSGKDNEGAASAEASGQVTFGSGGASASASAGGKGNVAKNDAIGPKAGEQERSYDYYRDQERAEESADGAALRSGSGFIIGAFLHIPRYFFSQGSSSDLAYGIGVTLRYAIDPHWSFISEVGFGGIGTVGQNNAMGGPLLFAGAEYRIPLTAFASDQLFFGAGIGYERQTNADTELALNYVCGRGRAGYRHVFGPQFGVEASLDGGYGSFFLSGLPDESDNSKSFGAGVLGGSVALLVGF